MSKLVIWVEFLIKPGHEEAFLQRVQQQAKNSLELETDCHQFDVCIDPENPARIMLYEIYSNSAAFDEHIATAHYKDFSAQVTDWIESKIVRCLHLVS